MITLDQNIKHADPEGFEELESPIGTKTHHAKVLSKRVEKTESPLGRLEQLDGPHAASGIFKFYIGTPKIIVLATHN